MSNPKNEAHEDHYKCRTLIFHIQNNMIFISQNLNFILVFESILKSRQKLKQHRTVAFSRDLTFFSYNTLNRMVSLPYESTKVQIQYKYKSGTKCVMRT